MASTVLTEAQLCNIALGLVGQRRTINNLLEATAEAQACAVLYGPARDEVLAEFPWTFATRRSTLAEIDDVERSGWEYVYALPSDFLEPQYIWTGARLPPIDLQIPFAIEMNDDGNGLLLVTDQEDAELIYTAKVTTVALFSPLFVKAVSWLLASELALMLPVKPQVAPLMLGRYRQCLLTAKAGDTRQGEPDVEPDSEFIRTRS